MMPATVPKALHEYSDEISRPLLQALQQPGTRYLAEEGISMKRAKYLQVRMQAAIRGFTAFYHRDHEYYRAAINKRLHIRNEAFPANDEFRNLWVVYDGMIKRPSEEFAEYLADLASRRESTGK